jgi:hypothetical protein
VIPRTHFKQLIEQDYSEPSDGAAFVHNGTPLATIEQDLGGAGRAETGVLA